jgi:hypothetical protein
MKPAVAEWVSKARAGKAEDSYTNPAGVLVEEFVLKLG